MPNAKDAKSGDAHKRILVVGKTGSGKSSQIWSLPGKKFAYIFDPNSLSTIDGADVEYEPFMPDVTELDATIKGFNKGAKSDGLASKREPKVYMRWVDDLNRRVDDGYFKDFSWLIFDSFTFLAKSIMDRQLWLNGRYGDIEDLADYRVVGSKFADVFTSIAGLPINIYATGHFDTYQDDKTKKIETQLRLPGRARGAIPLVFTDTWLTFTEEDGKGGLAYKVRTRPEPRGLQDIRCSIPGLNIIEDVTLSSPLSAKSEGKQGIGKLLEKGR